MKKSIYEEKRYVNMNINVSVQKEQMKTKKRTQNWRNKNWYSRKQNKTKQNENKNIKIKPKPTHQLLYAKMRACVPSKMVYGGTTKLTKSKKQLFVE